MYYISKAAWLHNKVLVEIEMFWLVFKESAKLCALRAKNVLAC